MIAGSFISTDLIPLEFFQAFGSKAAKEAEWIMQFFLFFFHMYLQNLLIKWAEFKENFDYQFIHV